MSGTISFGSAFILHFSSDDKNACSIVPSFPVTITEKGGGSLNGKKTLRMKKINKELMDKILIHLNNCLNLFDFIILKKPVSYSFTYEY